MVIKEFNFLLKNTQDAAVIKSAILLKLNQKATAENVGYIANIYDIQSKKIYLLVSDNVKTEQNLSDNIFEIGGGNSSIDVSKFATKEEVAQIQAGNVNLTGYLTKIDADSKYALKTELTLFSSTINSTIDQKLRDFATTSGQTPNGAIKILIEELQTNVDSLQVSTEALKTVNKQEKEAIDTVYKTLYIEILKLRQEVDNLKNSTQNSQVFTEADVPKLNVSLFNSDIKTEAEKEAEKVLNEGNVSISDGTENSSSTEDDVLIFD